VVTTHSASCTSTPSSCETRSISDWFSIFSAWRVSLNLTIVCSWNSRSLSRHRTWPQTNIRPCIFTARDRLSGWNILVTPAQYYIHLQSGCTLGSYSVQHQCRFVRHSIHRIEAIVCNVSVVLWDTVYIE